MTCKQFFVGSRKLYLFSSLCCSCLLVNTVFFSLILSALSCPAAFTFDQKYSRLRCLFRVKGLVFCFYLGWSGSILQFRQNIIKIGSNSWLFTCSSNITLQSRSRPAKGQSRIFPVKYFHTGKNQFPL